MGIPAHVGRPPATPPCPRSSELSDGIVNEATIEAFWAEHPCGDHIVGGLERRFAGDHDHFFEEYDAWRYDQEGHIPGCLDAMQVRGLRLLEIGLGQGAEAEQLIRRGARYSGLDLTDTSIARVRRRLELHDLPYDDLRQGSALEIPWPDSSFDVVFSHGVLHHIPDIEAAEREIHRVLKPTGRLVVMLYAKHSVNYHLSIRVLRRAALAAVYPLAKAGLYRPKGFVAQHVANAEQVGLAPYLRMESFVHRNTDGPLNPFARVYDRRRVERDFPHFEVVRTERHYPHAPPLPTATDRFGRWLGWHLWVHLRPRPA